MQVGMDLGELGDVLRVEYDQNTLYAHKRFSKNLQK